MAIDWHVILAGVVVALLALGLALCWLGVKRLRAAESLMQGVERKLDSGSKEQAELKPFVMQLGERVGSLEKRLRHLNERMTQVESRAQAGANYDQAIRMARSGAGPDELMRQCGLGQSEAKLVVAIHGAKS